MAKAKWIQKNDALHKEMEVLLKKHGIWDKTFIYALDVDGSLCAKVGGQKVYLRATLGEIHNMINK